jgi:DNA-directed RNA polymerase sigma subunit (sigma70/sigma32)
MTPYDSLNNPSFVGLSHVSLDPDEERSLIADAQSGGPTASSSADRLIRHTVLYALKLAGPASYRYAVDLSDAQWVAIGGLYEAIDKYDLANKARIRFILFARRYILRAFGAILNNYHTVIDIPPHVMQYKMQVDRGKIPHDLKRKAASARTVVDRVKYATAAWYQRSLDVTADSGADVEAISLASLAVADDEPAYDDEDLERLRAAVGRLSEIERTVIDGRWLADERKSYRRLASETGRASRNLVSAERRALEKLKRWLKAG